MRRALLALPRPAGVRAYAAAAPALRCCVVVERRPVVAHKEPWLEQYEVRSLALERERAGHVLTCAAWQEWALNNRLSQVTRSDPAPVRPRWGAEAHLTIAGAAAESGQACRGRQAGTRRRRGRVRARGAAKGAGGRVPGAARTLQHHAGRRLRRSAHAAARAHSPAVPLGAAARRPLGLSRGRAPHRRAHAAGHSRARGGRARWQRRAAHV